MEEQKYNLSEIVKAISDLGQYIDGEVSPEEIENPFGPIDYYLTHSEELLFQQDREKIDRGLIRLVIGDLRSRFVKNN